MRNKTQIAIVTVALLYLWPAVTVIGLFGACAVWGILRAARLLHTVQYAPINDDPGVDADARPDAVSSTR